MAKTIKVIDLLNKIDNGEDVPEKIRFEKTIFIYDKERKEYIHKIDDDGWQNETLLFRVMCTHFIKELIDAKVEIVEEQQDIDIQEYEFPVYADAKLNPIERKLLELINETRQAVKQLDRRTNNLKEE